MSHYISLAFFLLLVLAAAVVGAEFESGAWYHNLQKPDWTPPHWFYAPAWAVIYVLMALSAWTAWKTGHRMKAGALTWWFLVLALNVVWSWLMFGLNRTGWAFGLSVIMFGLSILCCRAMFLVSRGAGLLLLPLSGWLLFVAYLGYAIWAMNQGGFGSLLG